jgi:tetratricopeptide (TPR) repeat protein
MANIHSTDNIAEQLAAAGTLLDRGDNQGAMDLYLRITDQDPQCDEAWLMLGSLYAEAGDLSRATECVEKSIRLNPGDSAAYLTLGHIRRATGNTEGALESFSQAVQCSPDDAEIHCVLGSLLQETGALEGAIDAFGKAVSLDGSLVDAWKTLGYLQLKAGDAEQAANSFAAVLDREPADITALHGMVSVHMGRENYQGAEAAARSGLDMHPDRIELHAVLAQAQKAQGAYGKALETVEGLVARDPFSREILVLKADILERIGNVEQAYDLIKPYLAGDVPDVDSVLVFSRFSHKLGRRDECDALIKKLIDSGNLGADVREQLTNTLKGG